MKEKASDFLLYDEASECGSVHIFARHHDRPV